MERLLMGWLRLYETSAQPIYYKLVNTVYTHERHHDTLGIVRGHDVVWGLIANISWFCA